MIRAVGRAFVGDGELTERQGAILVAGSGVAFSVTAIAFRGVERASDFQFLTYRGLSTALVMVLLIIVRRSGRPASIAGVSWRTWAAALVLAVTSMLYILALSRTSAATTLFLLAAAPVFAAIIGWVLLRERVEQSTLIAIGITAVGVTIMVGAGLDAGSALGLFFAALIPVLVGLYSVIQRSVSQVDPVIPTFDCSSVPHARLRCDCMVRFWTRSQWTRPDDGSHLRWIRNGVGLTAVQPRAPFGRCGANSAAHYDRGRACTIVGLDLARRDT